MIKTFLKKSILAYSFRVLHYEILLERQRSRNDVFRKKNNDALKCSDLIEIDR